MPLYLKNIVSRTGAAEEIAGNKRKCTAVLKATLTQLVCQKN
jgi:hypothetical protein